MTRERVLAVGSAFVILALAVAAPVAHASHLRRVARSVVPLRTDGQRYGTFLPRAGVLAVRDFATGTTRTVAVAAGCEPQDGARGRFLINCRQPSGFATPFVLDASSLRLRRAAGTYDPRFEDFGRIGRYWLRGTNAGSGRPVVEYLDWRHGTIRTFGEDEQAVPRDLNTLNLKPLGRATYSAEVFASGRYVASLVADVAQPWLGPVQLRLNRSRSRTLDDCRRGCDSLSLGGGLATWRSGQRAVAYALADRHRRTWRLPHVVLESELASATAVTHTKRRVLLSVPDNNSQSSAYTIFAMTSPR